MTLVKNVKTSCDLLEKRNRRIEEEKIREQKRLEAERLEAERVRKEELIAKEKEAEIARLKKERMEHELIHNERSLILKNKKVGELINARYRSSKSMMIGIISDIDQNDFTEVRVYLLSHSGRLENLMKQSWRLFGNVPWAELNHSQVTEVMKRHNIQYHCFKPFKIDKITQDEIEQFTKMSADILTRVDDEERERIRLEEENKNARESRLFVYNNYEIAYIVACRNKDSPNWEYGRLITKGIKEDGSGMKVKLRGRPGNTYDFIRELNEKESEKILDQWEVPPRGQFKELIQRRATEKAELVAIAEAEKRASIELADKINKAKQSLSKPNKPKIANRSERRRDVPFNPFAGNAVDERNRLREKKPRHAPPVL